MKKNPFLLISIAIVVLTAVITAVVYPDLPDHAASHWNIRGEADDYSPKQFVAALIPGISVIILILFMVLPKMDPLQGKSRSYQLMYYKFAAAIIGFISYVHLLVLYWNLKDPFHFGMALAPAFALLWIMVAYLMLKTKRNWFVGFRTPWTLSSDAVWYKTHKLAAAAFFLLAGLTLVGMLFPDELFWLVIIPAVVMSLFIFFYSYVIYRQEEKHNKPVQDPHHSNEPTE